MVNPVIAVAKGQIDNEAIAVIEGIEVRVVPVSASLVDDVTKQVQDPEIPMWHNPDRERDEPNPSDPNYLKALVDANNKRTSAAMDTLIMFGIEISGMPSDDKWLNKLKFLEKRGVIDLSLFNLDDPTELEFLFKKLIVANANVLSKLSEVSGITQEEVKVAETSFPSN